MCPVEGGLYMAQIKTYRQRLESANSMIILAAVFAFVEAGLHIIVSMIETSGAPIFIPCIDSGLIVLLALLMMANKNTWAALVLLAFYVIRICLGTDLLLPGYWKLFVITPWSFAVMVFQIWGLYYTYRYNKLLPAAVWEAENIRAYDQSDNPPTSVPENRSDKQT